MRFYPSLPKLCELVLYQSNLLLTCNPTPLHTLLLQAHVMAILAMYPGCTLDRLQAMMCASTVPPK